MTKSTFINKPFLFILALVLTCTTYYQPIQAHMIFGFKEACYQEDESSTFVLSNTDKSYCLGSYIKEDKLYLRQCSPETTDSNLFTCDERFIGYTDEAVLNYMSCLNINEGSSICENLIRARLDFYKLEQKQHLTANTLIWGGAGFSILSSIALITGILKGKAAVAEAVSAAGKVLPPALSKTGVLRLLLDIRGAASIVGLGAVATWYGVKKNDKLEGTQEETEKKWLDDHPLSKEEVEALKGLFEI